MRSIATYVICTSPRSGSTLLCDLLAATGVAGNPGSWFHRPSLDDWARGLHVSRQEDGEAAFVSRLFDAARELGGGSGNVFGLRLQRHSFAFFFETLRRLHPASSSDVDCFERSFGPTLYIHLYREDKVGQAVSYIRAQQSGLWHVAADGSELERVAPHRDPRYDAAAIKAQVEIFTEFDRLWSAWFRHERIEPLRLSYARLADDPLLATRDLLENLGCDARTADHIVPGVSKMADATTEDWIARFQAEAPSGSDAVSSSSVREC